MVSKIGSLFASGNIGNSAFTWKVFGSVLALNICLATAAWNPASAADKEAQPQAKPDVWREWMDSQYATGNWGEFRDQLEQAGVTFIGSYTTDLLGNPVGGRGKGFTNFQWLELKLSFDLEKLVGWQGGQFVVSALSVAGQDLSARYIGNFFTASQLETSMNTFVLYDLYLEQRFWDDRIKIKAGRFSAGEDLGRLSILGLYVNGASDSHPLGLEGNFIFPTAPKPTWTAVVEVKPMKDLALKYAIYQTNEWYRLPDTHGWDFSIHPSDGVSMVWELDWRPDLALPWGGEMPTPSKDGKTMASHAPATFPGEYRFGVYYSNFDYQNFDDSGVTRDNFGFYWFAQQQVWQETPGSAQGITLWSTFTLSPQTRIAQYPFTLGNGASWVGLVPGRDRDITLLGSFFGTISPKFAAAQAEIGQGYPTKEWVLEASYRIQFTRWLYIQPDMQWIIRPGGTGDIPNALVLGGEIGITF